MAKAKLPPEKPASTPINPAISVPPAVDPGTGLVNINVFDGTRQPISQGKQLLVTVHDGAQNQLFRDGLPGPYIAMRLPVHNNFADNYSIVVSADGFEQAGFQPVKIGP